jgi:hypothetical protein
MAMDLWILLTRTAKMPEKPDVRPPIGESAAAWPQWLVDSIRRIKRICIEIYSVLVSKEA